MTIVVRNKPAPHSIQLPLVSSSTTTTPKRRRRRRRRQSKQSSLKTVILLLLVIVAIPVSLWIMMSLQVMFRAKIDGVFNRSIPCQAVYFWGGGKAGSTTLAALLKHDYDNTGYDPAGQFIDSPKEICWAERTTGTSMSRNDGLSEWRDITRNKCYGGPGGKRFVLDACPRYTKAEHAEAIFRDDPGAKFVMLVRDPIDRLVSHVNDKRRGGTLVDVEKVVRHLLSRYSHEGDDDGGAAGNSSRRRLRPDEVRTPPGGEDGVEGDVDDDILMAKRRRLTEYEQKSLDRTRIDRRKRKDMKRDVLRERLGRRKTPNDRMAERAELIRNRGGGATMRRAILGQRGEGIVPSKFSEMARLSKNHWQLSLYGQNLQSLLSVVPASQVLLVQTDALARDPQAVVNSIMEFIGGKKKRVKALHENQLHGRDSYKTISSELRRELEVAFQPDVALLETLVGRRFPWTWGPIRDKNGVEDVDDWLTTVPTFSRIKN